MKYLRPLLRPVLGPLVSNVVGDDNPWSGNQPLPPLLRDIALWGLYPVGDVMQGVKEGIGELAQASANSGYVLNSDKYWELLDGNSLHWHGALYVNNRVTSSEDFTTGNWVGAGTTPGVIDDFETFTLPADTENTRIQFYVPSPREVKRGETWVFSSEIEGTVGDKIRFYISNGSGAGSAEYEYTVEAGVKRVYVAYEIDNDVEGNLICQFRQSLTQITTKTFKARRMQFERTTHKAGAPNNLAPETSLLDMPNGAILNVIEEANKLTLSGAPADAYVYYRITENVTAGDVLEVKCKHNGGTCPRIAFRCAESGSPGDYVEVFPSAAPGEVTLSITVANTTTFFDFGWDNRATYGGSAENGTILVSDWSVVKNGEKIHIPSEYVPNPGPNLAVAANNLQDAVWVATGSTVNSQIEVNLSTAGSGRLTQLLDMVDGDTYVLSGELRAVSGNAGFRFWGPNNVGSTGAGTPQSITGEWVRYQETMLASGGAGGSFGFGIANEAGQTGVVQMRNFQVERNPAGSVAGTFVEPIHGKKVSIYENGNTVVNNVVTEAQGPAICDFNDKSDPDRIELYYAPELTNSGDHSQNVLAWSANNAPGSTATSIRGLDGKLGTGQDLNKTTGSNFDTYSHQHALAVTLVPHTFVLHVEKRTTAQYPEFRFHCNGGTQVRWQFLFDTETGQVVHNYVDETDATEVVDNGWYWSIYGTLTPNATNTLFVTVIYHAMTMKPSISRDLDAVGAIGFLGSELHVDKIIDQLRHCPLIPTTTAPVSVPRLDYQFDLANHDNAQGTYYSEWRPANNPLTHSAVQGVFGTRTDSGNLMYQDLGPIGTLNSYDGTTSLNPNLNPNFTKQEVSKLGITYDAADLSRYMNGNANEAEGAYDGAWALVTALALWPDSEYSARMFDLRRYDVNYEDGKKKLDQLIPLSEFYTLAFQALFGAADVQIGTGGLNQNSASSYLFRYKDQQYFDPVGAGEKIWDDGELVYLPATTNVLLHNRNFEDAAWQPTNVNKPSFTKNQIGIDGAANSAYLSETTLATENQGARQAVTITADTATHTAVFRIGKSVFGSSFPAVELRMGGSGGKRSVTHIDVPNGVFAGESGNSGDDDATEINDRGAYWELLIQMTNANHTLCEIQFWPARANALGGSASTPATGPFLLDVPELHLNKTIEMLRESSPIITAGASASVAGIIYFFDPANWNDSRALWSFRFRSNSDGDKMDDISASNQTLVAPQIVDSASLSYQHSTGNINSRDGTSTVQGTYGTWIAKELVRVSVLYDNAVSLKTNWTNENQSTEGSYDGSWEPSGAGIYLRPYGRHVVRFSDLRRYDCSFEIGKRVYEEVVTPRTPVFQALTTDATVDEGVGGLDQLSAGTYYPLDGQIIAPNEKHWDGDLVYHPGGTNLNEWTNDLLGGWGGTASLSPQSPLHAGQPHYRVTDNSNTVTQSLSDNATIPGGPLAASTVVQRITLRKKTVNDGVYSFVQSALIDGTTVATVVMLLNAFDGSWVTWGQGHSGVGDTGGVVTVTVTPHAWDPDRFQIVWHPTKQLWEILFEKAQDGNARISNRLDPAFNADGTTTADVTRQSHVDVVAFETFDDTAIERIRGMGILYNNNPGAALTVPRMDYRFDGNNHNNVQGAWYCETTFAWSSDEADDAFRNGQSVNIVGNATGILYHPPTDGRIASYDGVTSAQSNGNVWARNERVKMASVYGDTRFSCHTSQVSGDALTYDGAFPDGAQPAIFSLFWNGGSSPANYVMRIRNLRRYATNYEISKEIIEVLMS